MFNIWNPVDTTFEMHDSGKLGTNSNDPLFTVFSFECVTVYIRSFVSNRSDSLWQRHINVKLTYHTSSQTKFIYRLLQNVLYLIIVLSLPETILLRTATTLT